MGIKKSLAFESCSNYGFVKKAVKRFMPGENLSDAINATKDFMQKGILTVFTHLGENITQIQEAEEVKNHYLDVLENIHNEKIKTEISLKLTQIGLDLSFDNSLLFFNQVAQKASEYLNFVWIDMEGSAYTNTTIDFYRRTKLLNENTGVCLQAYLKRTEKDIQSLIDIRPNIRLVKGAYKEPKEIAFKDKSDVDKNYLQLAKFLLTQVKENGIKAVFGTHDLKIISEIKKLASNLNVQHEQIEFHMLYGIKTTEQHRLVNEGYKLKVLISYGSAWYPWYMRRLAERPANVGFVLKNIFSN
ncbi:MAG: proline dehydrogenase family protein [Bacteroidetes bacterium]|nr:proline dehydrogenase family protein [Bacteroidota bacterium]